MKNMAVKKPVKVIPTSQQETVEKYTIKKLYPSEQWKTTKRITRVSWKSLRRRENYLKRTYAKIRNENISGVDREIRKEYMKNYYHKGINLLNHLINHAEELENVCLSQ